MAYTSSLAKESLKKEVWEPGKVIPISEGPYRFRIVVHCSPQGRQKAIFQNGEHSYFSYVQLLDGNGTWIKRGAMIVPVLPDGRFIMTVEQRAARGLYHNPSIARINGRDVDLSHHGALSSLEFPGGAIDPGEGLKAGFLRELVEETGIEEQYGTYYARCRPIYPQAADLALQQFVGVIFLSGFSYLERVVTDGGLTVYALTKEDIMYNLQSGVLCASQEVLMPWFFYKEIEEALASSSKLEQLISILLIGIVTIKYP